DHWGIYDGDTLTRWVDDRLREAINDLNPTPPARPVGAGERATFGHLPPDVDLAIVTTRLDPNQSLVVYRRDRHPSMPIAEAVRQSVAIPFYFSPVAHDGAWHIDGGAASNF